MKKFIGKMFFVLITIAFIWIILTIWVEVKDKNKVWQTGSEAAVKSTMIAYAPVTFCEPDKKAC